MTDEIQCPKCGEPGLHPKGTCKCGYVPGSESVEMYDLRHQLAQSQAREREAVEARENAFVAARRYEAEKDEAEQDRDNAIRERDEAVERAEIAERVCCRDAARIIELEKQRDAAQAACAELTIRDKHWSNFILWCGNSLGAAYGHFKNGACGQPADIEGATRTFETFFEMLKQDIPRAINRPTNPAQPILDRLAEAEGVVAKLPKTADGVAVVPGIDTIWQIDPRGMINCPEGLAADPNPRPWRATYGGPMHITDMVCYSTREAAEAAESNDES